MARHEIKIILKAGKQEIVKRGHPWVFSGAISRVLGSGQAGDMALLCDHTEKPLAKGFYHPHSDIAFRLLCRDPAIEINRDFWHSRIQRAIALRKRILPLDTNAYRLINADGDYLPGLIVDRYADTLVLSISVFGMERQRELIYELLQQTLQPNHIYERSEGKSRLREGLAERCAWLTEPRTERLVIRENNLLFHVDALKGQKTGFFLDQRENRQMVCSLSPGLRVLNAFSYSGGFSVYAIQGGAQSVTSVEISPSANSLAKENLNLNHMAVDRHPLLTEDVFTYLRRPDQLFDLIILDPPAFAKTQKEVQQACRGYKDINLNAAKKLVQDGLLMTFSCSNHLDESLFQKVVLSAVSDAGRSAQVLKVLGPGADHPFQLAHPEGRYLKGLLLRLD